MHVYDIVKNYKSVRIDKSIDLKLKLITYFAAGDCYIDLCKDTEKNLFITISPRYKNEISKIYRGYTFRWPKDVPYFTDIRKDVEYRQQGIKKVAMIMDIIMDELSMFEKYNLK